MKQERVTLTLKELQRVKVMERLCAGDLSNQEAADELGICRRQIIRLKKKYTGQGDRGLIHGNRGRKPCHSIGEETRAQVLDLYRQKYYDFNFSHFTEQLNEEENVNISRSSVVRILKLEGITSKKGMKRKPKLHRTRDRRAASGELWQTDATPFQWFEGDVEYYTLHAYIDDATGVVVGAHFTKNECTVGYVEALRQGIEEYGIPQELYSDRHTIFRSPKGLTEEEKADGKEKQLTNFGMGLAELGIHHAFARTPQAKGRIERLWGTFHDRLTAEMRLAGIKNIKEANKFLPRFIARHNEKFAVEPKEKEAVYVPLDRKIDFDLLFAKRDTRKTDNGGVISYHGCSYAPAEGTACPGLARVSVEVRDTLDGRIVIVHNDKFIKMERVEKPRRASELRKPENKGSRLVTPHKPAPDHPWRHSPIGKTKRGYDSANREAYAP